MAIIVVQSTATLILLLLLRHTYPSEESVNSEIASKKNPYTCKGYHKTSAVRWMDGCDDAKHVKSVSWEGNRIDIRDKQLQGY